MLLLRQQTCIIIDLGRNSIANYWHDAAICINRSFLSINVQYMEGIKLVLKTLAGKRNLQQIYCFKYKINFQKCPYL